MTQLETVPLLSKKYRDYKYEKLPQDEKEPVADTEKDKAKHWWSDRKWKEKNKSEERTDNKKNEIVEKQMELKEKQRKIRFSTETATTTLSEENKKVK